MRISRFYLPTLLKEGMTLSLEEERSHYVRTVLRLKQNDALTLFNGQGGEYRAHVVKIHREGVNLEVGTYSPQERESPLSVHLGLGISRSERMDWAIQKSVELGVRSIIPLFTERSVVRLEHDRLTHRWAHWQKTVYSACEQSGRNRVPEVHFPLHLENWLRQSECEERLRLYLDPYSTVGFRHIPAPSCDVVLLSGPEGGFSEKERAHAQEVGFIPVRLGPRILRTETAALSALACIQSHWGDIGS